MIPQDIANQIIGKATASATQRAIAARYRMVHRRRCQAVVVSAQPTLSKEPPTKT